MSVSLTPVEASREQLRAGLMAHRLRERAARVLDEQRTERAALRAARTDADAAQDGATLQALTSGQRPNLEVLAAQRRDRYRAALSYPMDASELLAAVVEAVESIRLPDDDARSETIAALMAHVIGRHGTAPLRCDVGRGWLRTRAQRIYERESFKRERATGLRASAAMLAQWQAADDGERDGSGPDAVWYLAANTPAPRDTEPLSADAITERLGLTERQREALALALAADKRVTLALSGAERKAATMARAALRRSFPDAQTLRVALRRSADGDWRAAAALAVESAQRTERDRATVAGRGSALRGQRDSASAQSARIALRHYGCKRLMEALAAPLTEAEQRAAARAAGRRLAADCLARTAANRVGLLAAGWDG